MTIGASGYVNFTELLRPGIGNDVAASERTTTRHSFVGRKGDLTVELHYGDFGTGHGRQAALYIFQGRKEKDGVFIPLSAMWMYAERDALHVMVPHLAKQLWGFVTQQEQIRLLDAILDYLGDLRKSPPDPQLFEDKSLDRFLEGCEEEGLHFFVDVNNKRVVG
ncbi:hypothetical protein [Dyella japonica]|uniref:Uncharacterized protein n=1 Tax=Dyella japonica DSM 16301 TaxID=1440762 RepID=A0A0G9HCK1_9GAMM|nr:hypothetical protein [Dyella japonica]KLD65432.1 hypothetical protein Y882_02615 [Dyella japonica DSM 16301]